MLPTLRSTRRVGIDSPETLDIPSASLLPKQPGNSWDDVAFKTKHSRSQGLQRELMGHTGRVYQRTHVSDRSHPPPEFSQSEKVSTLLSCLDNSQPLTQQDDAQAVRDLDSKVLRFYGYWREASVESAVQTSRLRKVVICVFPHDETVMVLEPRVPNSGFQGGTLVKRHRIPAGLETARKRNSQREPQRRIPSEELEEGEEHLNPNDFNVGDDVTIYGKCIHIVSCDRATREFLGALGVEVNEEEAYPQEEYFTEHKVPPSKLQKSFADFDMRKTFEHSAKGRVTTYYPNEIKRVRSFLAGEAQVCRFWACWDDVDNPHGDLRRFEIRYHLQDDTMEVLEKLPPNSGREPSRAFVQRRKIPRKPEATRSTDLTFASRANGFRYEAPDGAAEDVIFYTIGDLRVGNIVNVYGRPLMIYTADPWTREFFKREMEGDLGEDIVVEGLNPKQRPTVVHPPKHNKFGAEEDSLGNCKSLVLRAPRKDVTKWQRYADILLRFKLRLHNPADANDKMRRFILTFFMADDTLMINEVSVRNTGFLAGRFLKRQRCKKFDGEGSQCYYTQADIDAGGVLKVMGHRFEVLEMDEYTQKFKAGEKHTVVATDVSPERVHELATQLRHAITTKHVTLTEAFRHYDKDRDGALPLHEVSNMFVSLNIRAEEGELVALMHHFDLNKDGRLSLNEFVAGITGSIVKSMLDGADAEFGTAVPPPETDEEMCRTIAGMRPKEVCRERVLRVFKEKLESKQINLFEMYRMLSTMPSSYRSSSNRKDIAALGSGGSDSLLGPVQLRRGVEERFSFGFTEEELDMLMQFFFPTLPKHLYNAPREETAAYRLSLSDFQDRWNTLERLGQLAPDMSLK